MQMQKVGFFKYDKIFFKQYHLNGANVLSMKLSGHRSDLCLQIRSVLTGDQGTELMERGHPYITSSIF